jgi:hypothetical protein
MPQVFWSFVTIFLMVAVFLKIAIYLKKKGLREGVDCLVWIAVFMAAMLYRIYTIINLAAQGLGH